MTTITLNEVLEKEAWSSISSKNITLDMLEKYADKLDWRAISENRSIPWTIDALQKFADRIDWNEFSQYCPEHLISDSFLQLFCDRLNWEVLSQYKIFQDNWDLLEKFADKVNWSEIIHIGFDFSNPLAFFERFRQYVPLEELHGSSLWCSMLDERIKALCLEMGGEKTA